MSDTYNPFSAHNDLRTRYWIDAPRSATLRQEGGGDIPPRYTVICTMNLPSLEIGSQLTKRDVEQLIVHSVDVTILS